MKKETPPSQKNRLELRRASVRPLDNESLTRVNGGAGPVDKTNTTTITLTTTSGIPTSG